MYVSTLIAKILANKNTAFVIYTIGGIFAFYKGGGKKVIC